MIFKNSFVLIKLFCIFWVNVSKTQIIETTSGSVKGMTINVLNKTIEQYLGIPYAKPPIGSLRFAKPKPISKPIKGLIDATKPKNSCYQSPNSILMVSEDISEDCLYLNIWNPKSSNESNLKPVMFWIYGGAFFFGSIFQSWYNGSVLATHDVVLVSVNYRLGWFGFLYGNDESAPGNVGLYDQVLGMKWVRDNIHLFGGDKNQITVFGASSGGWSVSAHILSPVSKGLFNRAILLGGAYMYNKNRPVISKKEALIKAKQFSERLDCGGDQWLDCLRGLDSQSFETGLDIFFPVDNTEFLPKLALKAFEQGQFNNDLLAGVVKNEGTLLSYLVNPRNLFTLLGFHLKDFQSIVNQMDLYVHDLDFEKLTRYYFNNTNVNNSTAVKHQMDEFVGDLIIKCPTYHFAKQYSRYSSPDTNVYFYHLTHTAYENRFGLKTGIHHSADVELLFGDPLLFPGTTSLDDIEFSKVVMKLFTEFAKTGKPDLEWPPLSATDANTSQDLIKELNPKDQRKYSSNSLENSCNGFWKNYFL